MRDDVRFGTSPKTGYRQRCTVVFSNWLSARKVALADFHGGASSQSMFTATVTYAVRRRTERHTGAQLSPEEMIVSWSGGQKGKPRGWAALAPSDTCRHPSRLPTPRVRWPHSPSLALQRRHAHLCFHHRSLPSRATFLEPSPLQRDLVLPGRLHRPRSQAASLKSRVLGLPGWLAGLA